MKNFSENTHKLREAREKADKVSELSPDWMSLGSVDHIHPEEKREEVTDHLWKISFCEELKDWAHGQLPSVNYVEDREIFEWYRTEGLSIINKAFQLILEKISSDLHWPAAPVSDKRAHREQDKTIKTALSNIMVFMRDYLNDRKDQWEQLVYGVGLDVWSCEKIVERPYFEPDAWIKNERLPVMVARSVEVPPPVRRRVEEIRKSFIFGNWMAVIALSRCLVEYAILDNKPICGIECPPPRGLDALVSCVNKEDRALAKLMRYIKDEGDKVMHPADHAEDKSNFQKIAEECFVRIAKIIGILYSR
ncbi:MAG: hypothetical protein MPL62_12985 [Alphaproteobacteria bacterium]|nr:hypothetical protein [Alphaproteobacteria bacterium]